MRKYFQKEWKAVHTTLWYNNLMLFVQAQDIPRISLSNIEEHEEHKITNDVSSFKLISLFFNLY